MLALAAGSFCGCANNTFMAISSADNQSGGVYCISADNEISHTPIPRVNYMIKSSDRSFYATRNGTKTERSGSVVVMTKNDNGTMNIRQTVSTGGITPCHLAISPCGKFLYTANYSSGNLSEFKIKDGRLLLPPRHIRHTGSSVMKRQRAPHPHFTGFNPASKELFVCDLGTDEIVIYQLGDNGAKCVSKLKLPPGSGPRHLAFAPDGKTIYVANELASTVSSFINLNGNWKIVKTISSRPEKAAASKNFPGAIKISSCGRFFFVTNRGDDTIAVFETLDNGDFRLSKTVPAGGKYPSDILFSDDGKLLLSINLKSGSITRFRLDKTSGTLTPLPGTILIPRGIGLCK